MDKTKIIWYFLFALCISLVFTQIGMCSFLKKFIGNEYLLWTCLLLLLIVAILGFIYCGNN